MLVPEAFIIKRIKFLGMKDMLKVILLGSVPVSLFSQKMEFVKEVC